MQLVRLRHLERDTNGTITTSWCIMCFLRNQRVRGNFQFVKLYTIKNIKRAIIYYLKRDKNGKWKVSSDKVDNKWQEVWTIKACSRTATVPINFELKENGGTYAIDPMGVRVITNK